MYGIFRPVAPYCQSKGIFLAVQLEEAMLFGKQGRKADAEPAAKRRRSTASIAREPEVASDEATWAALAEVYMQLRESHLAHVACSTHLARYCLLPEGAANK